MKKLFTFTLITFFIGFIALGIILQLDGVKNYAKKIIVEKIQEKTGYIAEFDEFHLYPSLQVYIKNARLKDYDNLIFETTFLQADFSLLSLFKKEIHFSSLHLGETSLANIPQFSDSSPISKKIQIDDLFVMSLTYENFSFMFRGKLSIDPDKLLTNLDFKLWLNKESENFYSCKINYNLDVGEFKLFGQDLSIDFNFSKSPITITNFNTKFIIENKSVDFASDILEVDFSKFSPINGSIRSPKLYFQNQLFENLNLGVKNDKINLSFISDNNFHNFYADINYENNLFKNLSLKANLSDISKIIPLDFGYVDGELDLQLSSSKIVGNLSNGKLSIYNCDTYLSDISAKFEGDFDTIALKKISATTENNGIIKGKGQISLSKNFPYTFNLEPKKASLFKLDNFSALFSGNLEFKGNINQASLSGKLISDETRILLTKKKETSFDNVEVLHINGSKNKVECTNSPIFPIDLDIKLSVNKNGFVNGAGLTSEWKGKANVRGSAIDPKIHGEFQLSKGNYLFRGKTFDIKEGNYSLSGNILKKAKLYLKASIDIEKNTITAIIKGPPKKISIALQSTPPMNKQEILSWLLFNKGVKEITPLQSTKLNESMLTLGDADDGKPDLLTKISSSFGLDSIDIGAGTEDISLKVGKYLSSKTMLSITKKFNQSSVHTANSCVGIETDLGKHIRLQAEVGDDSNGQVNLLWKKDY